MSDPKVPLLNNNNNMSKPPVSRPKNRRRRSSFEASTYNSTTALGYVKQQNLGGQEIQDPGLSLLQLLALTLCMAGVQFTWTVELSYGTPYLLSLNLSKELTALVWLAGPLSGLIVQPVIGAFSDKCTSNFGKRRPFIVGAGFLTCLAMIGVAYAKELGAGLAHLFSNETSMEHTYAIVVAVGSFYFLDFTLNAVQAICRALILDIPPLWQQDRANAWSARMSNSAMVIGYFVGYIDLVKYFPWMGDSQIKVFCIVAMLVFCLTLGITCFCVKEKPLDQIDQEDQPWYHTFIYIWRAFRFLPRPIQTLCNTQFFAWMGWFPFLFYSTQWVSDIYFATHPIKDGTERDWAEGTRAGSFALLCYSVVSVVAGVVIPALSMKFEKRQGWLSLNNIYTGSHLVSAAALLSAWVIKSVLGATIMLSVMGISWAIVLWIPFSLVGEYVSYEDERRSTVIASNQDYGSIITSASSSSQIEAGQQQQQQDEFDAGMILGVHNMYIVFPQFAVAIISAFIFAINDAVSNGNEQDQTSSVASVLVFGGFMALIAAVFSRYIVRVKQD
ncbi:major facilitator superfamily domain-containing protein [Halteromyces radiatus]|uniref:major facilitator superfamily domain-containing protein n=1 Tax=Halteromyces radiatus TaxID=101107 RepID=UPI00221F4FC6|nr:major facilitator superfamily domain-containing protein [Halteromyces radiatus]KAI8096153.1 major facilitator superfamily domain-containing protein [Halteromyces radiatus]